MMVEAVRSRVVRQPHNQAVKIMDKDRIVGSAKVVEGKIKVAVGKVLGDAKLQAEGQVDKIEGSVQNAVGSIKDAVKGE